MFIDFINIAYASISDSLCAFPHCLFAMNPFTCSGFCRLQFFCRCLSLLPVASIVVSAYPFFFMYQSVFGMLQYSFDWDDVEIAGDAVFGNVEIARDAVASWGYDVAVPDRPLQV